MITDERATAAEPTAGPVNTRTKTGPGAAFFDVDETLLTVKSMISFYRFLAAREEPAEREARLTALQRLLDAGLPREQANVEYYRLLAGLSEDGVRAAGEDWFAEQLERGAVVRPVARRLAQHLARGHRVTLVSGSFPACLDPVARYFAVTTVLCSRPDIADGRYTGTLAEPMIGNGKARAVAAVVSTMDDGSQSWAYGDHASDLPMLEQVGHPVVVGPDPVLRAQALQRGWERIGTGEDS